MEILERYAFLEPNLPITTGIYRIYNKINGKQYIGSARAQGKGPSGKGFRRRFGTFGSKYGHRGQLSLGNHHCVHLQNSFNYYINDLNLHPDDVFEIHILEYLEPARCLEIEDWYLKYYEPEYNDTLNASGGRDKGYNHSPEAKAKVSRANKGRRHTDESRAKMSAAQKDRVFTDEHRYKISASKLGNKYFLGKSHTDSARHAIAEALMDNSNGAKSFVGLSPAGEEFFFTNAYTFATENKLNYECLIKCANGQVKTHKKWRFYHAKDYPPTSVASDLRHKDYIVVFPDGTIEEFSNAREFCRRHSGFDPSAISKCAKGKHSVHNSCQFFYKEDYTEEVV
jgi:group I intron endonuclease